MGWVILTFGDATSPYAFFYLWLSVHSFYFLPWRRAAPQLVLIAADYGATLVALGPPFLFVRWWITVLTTVVISVMVALLKRRVDTLVGHLAAVARTDPLTHLRNRRAFDEMLRVEVARAERTGQPLALILGDLDHFKSVNDQLGHPAGDAVLRRVASCLERTGRQIDVPVRLGGEEFALLLPDTDIDGAYLVAERMRLMVDWEFAHDDVPITISFGIASFPEDASDATSLFATADGALLAAKQAGRDRSVSARAPRRHRA